MDLLTQINEILAQISKEKNDKLKTAMNTIIKIISRKIQDNFDAGGRTTGSSGLLDGGSQSWKPISKSYKEHLTKHKIAPLKATLQRTGNLKKSINVTAQGLKVSISVDSRVPYAQIHQFGGTVSGTANVPAHTRKITQAFGKKIKERKVTVKAHSKKVNYEIPARPFVQLTPEDIEEIRDYLLSVM